MSIDHHSNIAPCFTDLNLKEQLLNALLKSGYSTPTQIQIEMIPIVLEGRDVVGQAQTGTGKTAAFALPLLNNLAVTKKASPQVLVLAPTRELAIQVSDSFEKYGSGIKKLSVMPIYGGQDYATQLQKLRKGVHIVVGTPGRIMDHIRRGSLKLDSIKSFVLDEADEMLKMGFLEDVKWILEQLPQNKQTALFSATMPTSIRKIAQKYLNNPVEITIKEKTVTASKISQRYLITNGHKAKKEALKRVLQSEDFEGMLLFVRTKIQTIELAEFLNSLGYSSGPLNGDIPQNQRLRMIDQLKSGKLDIVVATDVAARGLDVERISHVINYDVPYDNEAYIHRIGRTGRAGRTGSAILFLHPREKKMLKPIERQTGGKIALMHLPSVSEINIQRVEKFKKSITSTLSDDCSFFEKIVDEYCCAHDTSPQNVAAALAKMLHNKNPLLLQETTSKENKKKRSVSENRSTKTSRKTAQHNKSKGNAPEAGMDRYRIEIGDIHGVNPGNIVGAIANEADIDSEYIGRISIFNDYSTVDLPYGMPGHILKLLQRTRVCNRMMLLRKETVSLPEDMQVIQGKRKPKKSTLGEKKRKSSGRKNRQAQKVTH